MSGNAEIHHAAKYTRPSATAPPQDGVGGDTPTPKKLRMDSRVIRKLICEINSVGRAPAILGNKKRTEFPGSDAPAIECWGVWSITSRRMGLMYRMQVTRPMTIIKLIKAGPM